MKNLSIVLFSLLVGQGAYAQSPPCYTAPTLSYTAPAAGRVLATFLIYKGPSCAWFLPPAGNVVSNVSWITIRPETWWGYAGTGIFTFDIAPNTGDARLGLITAVGLTFTVRQFGATDSIPATGAAEPSLAALDTLMTNAMNEFRAPGGALAVTYQGRLVYARGFGYSDLETLEVVQPDSLFRLASVSKLMTMAAIGKLEKDNVISPSSKAFTILNNLTPPPGLAVVDQQWFDITVDQLINHKGGFLTTKLDRAIDYNFLMKATAALKQAMPGDNTSVIRYAMSQALDYPPGSPPDPCPNCYSNFGYQILGRVVEKAAGLTYEDYIRNVIMAPVGVTRTRAARSFPDQAAPGEVKYYTSPAELWRDSEFADKPGPALAAYGAPYEHFDSFGGMISNTMDLLRFYNYWIDWRPGGAFFGSLGGTNTGVATLRASNNVRYSFLFNYRSNYSRNNTSSCTAASPCDLLTAVYGDLETALAKITAWPSGDSFPQYSGPSPACVYSLTSGNLVFDSSAQGGGVTVTPSGANCSWTAVSDLPWATLGSASGTGSALVGLTISANTGNTPRQGTIYLAGRPVTVTQAAVPAAQTYTIRTVAGYAAVPQNMPATSASLGSISGVAVDAAGNVFMSLSDYSAVVKMDPTGFLTLVAGGSTGFCGDNGPATSACLDDPNGLAIDSAGNLYIADRSNNRVRRVSNGVITTAVGNGVFPDFRSPTFNFKAIIGYNGPATGALLYRPSSVALDATGNLYIADSALNVVRKVSSGVIATVAGNGDSNFSGDGGPATSAGLSPQHIAVDSAGNLYIADRENQVRKVSNGKITTVAGNGQPGFRGDNGPAFLALLQYPAGIAVDPLGNLYIADSGNNRVRKVSGGIITTVVGNGQAEFGGDNGPASQAQLPNPQEVAVDSAGNLYIADSGRVRKVSAGLIATVAGNVTSVSDNAPAAPAQLSYPADVAVDSAGNLYIAETGNNRIRKVSGGIITTVAGGGSSAADNVPATNAKISSPSHIAVDSAGNLFINDYINRRVRKVSNGIITTVAGGGSNAGDNVLATSAILNGPGGLAVDAAGNLYIADYATNNSRVRKVSGGRITTVAGGGSSTSENVPATSALLYGVAFLAVDSAGNLYLSDYLNHRVRKVSGGVIATVAGNGTAGFSGDGGPAASAKVYAPAGLAVDSTGNLYISDSYNNRVRKVSGGVITTVVGSGSSGFSGDNGPPTGARLFGPDGLAFDAVGNLYIADIGNKRVRVVGPAPPSTITRITHGATLQEQALAPTTIFSLFSDNLGPPTRPGGAQVYICGVPVQLLLNASLIPGVTGTAPRARINGVVPPEAAGQSVCKVDVYIDGFAPAAAELPIADRSWGLFTETVRSVSADGGSLDLLVATNSRGELVGGPPDSGRMAAKAGDDVTLWGTGCNGQDPGLAILISDQNPAISYAGPSVDRVGMCQIALRIPDLPPGPYDLSLQGTLPKYSFYVQ